MPEISRFYGLSIRMYVERGERHHLPHFHAIYQGKADELLANWHRLHNDEATTRIAPLV